MNNFGSETIHDPADLARARIQDIHARNPLEAPRPVSPLQEAGQAARPAPLAAIADKSQAITAKPGLPSKVKPILTAAASFVVILSLFKLPVFLQQFSYLAKKPAPAPVVTPVAQVETASPEPVISIPKINVNAPVVYEPSIEEAKIQKSLQNGVVHYATTAKPGEPGNSVFVGHSSNDWWEPGNYKFVFVLLDKLAPGDTFSLNYGGRKYIYEVTDSKVVEPTDLSVLAPTAEPMATLITCTPPGTNWKRLIVRGKQISPTPEQVRTQATTTSDNLPSILLPGSAPSFMEQIGQVWHNLKQSVGGWFGT
jgi:sortase A